MLDKPRICPYCGNDTFITTAHVTQDWVVDSYGNFIKCLNDAVEVTHEPDPDNTWQCTKCGKEYE